MSDHSKALVPIESWSYNSPDIRAFSTIDVGLMAESLIYYDCIYLNVSNPKQFSHLIRWFIANNSLKDFISLIDEGSIKIYEYSFITTAINHNGVHLIGNIQDPIQAEQNTFEKRYLYNELVTKCIPKSRQRSSLHKSLRGNVIEVKANEFSSAIENARADNGDFDRRNIVLQAFVDELYRFKKLGKPPAVEATQIAVSEDGNKRTITWNVDFNELASLAGKELNFHIATPLTAGAIANRYLLTASKERCDLYLGSPMSSLVGNKLYESAEEIMKIQNLIDQLNVKVEFPDIRTLVNMSSLSISEVLKIRKKACKFRKWLQDESERDRDAIIAYHHEVAKETGIVSAGRKSLKLFGIVGGGSLGSLIGRSISGPSGEVIGAAAGGAAGYLFEVASKIGSDWKPVVFGNWVKDEISQILDKKSKA